MWLSTVLVALARALLGVTPRWIGCQPTLAQRIYFANHTSHADTVALWAALPPALRQKTHPVAAADYWGRNRLTRFVAIDGMNALLIDRLRANPDVDPLIPVIKALEAGQSIIIFPEGKRLQENLPGPFKSGLFRLSLSFPTVELIPVYLENLHRSLPKGTLVPVPLICTVRFGAPLERVHGEEKAAFLDRARSAVVSLAP